MLQNIKKTPGIYILGFQGHCEAQSMIINTFVILI